MTPRLALSLLFFLALTACGPPWKVIRQSGPPSALAGQQLIGVSFDWSRAILGGQPEAQWLATQPPEDQQSYLEVRNAIMQTYINELASQPAGRGITVVAGSGQEPIQLIVQPLMLEMGFYRFMVNMDSRLDSALVFTMGGQETDHIEVHTTAESNMANAQIIGRLSQCALRTARLTAEFIRRAQSQ
jgi:hypothetical protein